MNHPSIGTVLRLSLSVVVLGVLCMLPILGVAHIEQPDVIDLVSTNKERTEVNLGIVQQNEWDGRTIELLRRKVRTYLAFVESRTMERKYPETTGKRVVLEVAYFVEPNNETLAQLDKLRGEVEAKGMKLRWFKLPRTK